MRLLSFLTPVVYQLVDHLNKAKNGFSGVKLKARSEASSQNI
jgi:hypothetical protein